MIKSFGKLNFAVIALGAAIGFFGLYLLSLAPVNNPISLNVAPFVTLFGYLVVVPAGILWPSKETHAVTVSTPEKKAVQAK